MEGTGRVYNGETSNPTSMTETVSGTYDFKLTGFSLSKGIGFGNYIKSNIFMVGGSAWAINFYPDGKNEDDNSTYVSLFVVRESEVEVRAAFELTLVDQSGRGRHKIFGSAVPYTLQCRGSMWGYKRFFDRAALEASDYIKNDCLEVHCRVGVVRSQAERPQIPSMPLPLPPSDIGKPVCGNATADT